MRAFLQKCARKTVSWPAYPTAGHCLAAIVNFCGVYFLRGTCLAHGGSRGGITPPLRAEPCRAVHLSRWAFCRPGWGFLKRGWGGVPAAYPRVPPWADMERPFGLPGRTRASPRLSTFLVDRFFLDGYAAPGVCSGFRKGESGRPWGTMANAEYYSRGVAPSASRMQSAFPSLVRTTSSVESTVLTILVCMGQFPGVGSSVTTRSRGEHVRRKYGP